MMQTLEFLVFVDIEESTYFIGRLWSYFHNDRETASFEYDKSWLANPLRFSLEPALTLYEGKFHTEKNMFGSIGDSAPDRWGRILMRRFEAEKSKKTHQKPRQLNEIDYLTLVNDELRQGSLRFKRSDGGDFLSSDLKTVPLLTDLSRLLSASRSILENKEVEQELRLLLAPGSSLGGARPKACVSDNNGNLHIAKFSRKDDEFSVVLWEAVALILARDVGITVPQWQLQKDMIIIQRFDRYKKQRIPFLSAMSMLGASDNESGHSYLEIADAIIQYGAYPKNDLAELWRRIVFNILISNTDDHLRNHAFLYEVGKGWKLSPVYDINPDSCGKNALSLNISETDCTQSLDLALAAAEYFHLTMTEVKTIVEEVARAVQNWRNVARSLNINNREIELMENAFNI
jgi:serine/threonine-protein kinase HipA